MAKILIVTAWYHPFFHPRAHRWTAIAEHWAAQGHTVHVVCSRRRDCSGFSEINGVQVHRRGFDSLKELFYFLTKSEAGRGRPGQQVQPPGWKMRLANWLYSTFWKKIYFPDDACIWLVPAWRKAIQLLDNEAFDAIFTVSLPFTGHLIGLALRQRFPGLFWLADVGDPFSIHPTSRNNALFYGRLNRHFEQKTLQKADAVVVTTEATKAVFEKTFGRTAKIHVIPPLLHPRPILEKKRTKKDQNEIHCGYFGAFYNPERRPDAFLDLLEKTLVKMPDLKANLRVHFYGEIFPEFFQKIENQKVIQMHGLCARTETRAAMHNMDFLLNIGNATDFQLPSKAVEYLATGLPIVNLSLVENDPFSDFFRKHEAVLLDLKIEKGTIRASDFEAWLDFLKEKKWENWPQVERQKVGDFLVGSVAGRYAGLAGF